MPLLLDVNAIRLTRGGRAVMPFCGEDEALLPTNSGRRAFDAVDADCGTTGRPCRRGRRIWQNATNVRRSAEPAPYRRTVEFKPDRATGSVRRPASRRGALAVTASPIWSL
jgi:hypothetical protein